MSRQALALLLLAATTAAAQVRARAVQPTRPDLSANSVSGVVSSVSGPFILLANGLVTIDTTGAKLPSAPAARTVSSAVEPCR